MGLSKGLDGYNYTYNVISNFPYGVATGTPTPSATYSDGGFNWQRVTFTTSANLVVSSAGLMDIFVLGGGGGGGSSTGGGEGGGGAGAGVLFTGTIYVAAGTYAVIVGAGGSQGEPATFGGWSGIGTLKIQVGGGAGGGQRWGGAVEGPNSGGASYRGGYGGNPGKASQQLYGFSSGSSTGSGTNGGGAGMGGAGGTPTAGAGITSTFTGTSVTYAAGGLGGGTSGLTFGGSGAANSGTGGGGAVYTTNSNLGGNGGSGVVIVRWKVQENNMAHFAEVKGDIVTQVIVVGNDDCGGGNFPESEPIGQAFIASIGLQGEWKQTSYNSNFRGVYAGIGYRYDRTLDEFVAPIYSQPVVEVTEQQ